MMFSIAGIVFVVGCLVVPSWWVGRVMRRYHVESQHLAGDGMSLAQHFNQRFALEAVVTDLPLPSHYDPRSRTINIQNSYAHSRSLTSIAIATHEVGHAIQHRRGEKMFTLRHGIGVVLATFGKYMWVVWLALPLLTYTNAKLGLLALTSVVVFNLLNVVFHVITLPVEWDASFTKALPILQQGDYVRQEDLPAIRSILRAAVFTYIAGALLNTIFIWRMR